MPKDNFIRRPIPENKDPDFVCFKINLPDDKEYIQAFMGQLQQLALWTQYDRTGNNEGKLVADVWRRSIETLKPCVTDCENEDCGCEECNDCEEC